MTRLSTDGSAAKRNYSYIYIRSLGCLAVICMHVVYSALLLNKESLGFTAKFISTAVTYCLMWAVPCFVMVTGALLLRPEKIIGCKQLRTRYISRVAGALILFVLAYRVFDVFMDKEEKTVTNFLLGFKEVFTGDTWAHMWYLYLLIGLYILLPFYKKIAGASGGREIKYLLLVYFIFISLLPVLEIFGLKTAFYIHVSTIYPFYLFAGYAIASGIIKIKKPVAAAVFVLSTALTVLITYLSLTTEKEFAPLIGYSSVPVVLQSLSLFALLFSKNGKEPAHMKKPLALFDSCGFGIYLVHMIFVRLILRYAEFDPYQYPWSFPLLIAGIALVSFVIVFLLRKIPLIKKFL